MSDIIKENRWVSKITGTLTDVQRANLKVWPSLLLSDTDALDTAIHADTANLVLNIDVSGRLSNETLAFRCQRLIDSVAWLVPDWTLNLRANNKTLIKNGKYVRPKTKNNRKSKPSRKKRV